MEKVQYTVTNFELIRIFSALNIDHKCPGCVTKLGQKKKNCYIGVTRPTLKLGPTLHLKKKTKNKKTTDRS